jgi:hypothetical protein
MLRELISAHQAVTVRKLDRQRRSLESLLKETLSLLGRAGQGQNWEASASDELLDFLRKMRR